MSARIEDLIQFSTMLSDAGVMHALGGSGLMNLLGIDVQVNDWDITTEADEERVSGLLSEYQSIYVKRTHPYTSKYLYRSKIGLSEIDLIGDFSVATETGIVHCKTHVRGIYQGVPLGCLNEWYAIYKALGKFEKCALIERYTDET